MSLDFSDLYLHTYIIIQKIQLAVISICSGQDVELFLGGWGEGDI